MVIVIVGPTAVGKTSLSISLAKALNGEVINADSTQVYRNLNIATAKATVEERENIVHHLLDIKDLEEDYTVFDYQKDARLAIEDILKRGKTPILVGGTGLYIKAALYDYVFEDQLKKKDYSMFSKEEMYQKLKEVDPNTTIHPNNRKRVERAYQYYQENGKPMSAKEKSDTLLYDTIFIGLTTNRTLLYERINQRVEQMVEIGLLEEAKAIFDTGIRTKAVLTPIGYKELFPYFEGKEDLSVCLEKIKQNSRKYAKRQYTYFNHQLPVVWFPVHFEDFSKTVQEVIAYIKKSQTNS